MRFFIYILLLTLFISCSPSQPDLSPLRQDDIILAFGDSLTYGTGAPNDASYPVILERLIGFKVINAGQPGAETADSIERLSIELEKTQPRLVILCLGGNDLIRKRPLEQIKQNLKTMIQLIKAQGAQVILISTPRPSLNLIVPDFYQVLGEELHIPVDNDLLASLLRQQEYKSDYIHLNAAGYEAFAKGIAAFLKHRKALS